MIISNLTKINTDSILGLMTEFQADPFEEKIDLTVGIYKNDMGQTPIMDAVKIAEKQVVNEQLSKKYLPPIGLPAFRAEVKKLVLGALDDELADRVAIIQTPGGCGALRVGAELYGRANSVGEVYLSSPTWGNHHALFSDAGLAINEYPYYNSSTRQIDFEKMLAVLEAAPSRSLVLVQACCHNPTGADLSDHQFDALLELLERRELVPFFDMAYLGLGSSLENDARQLRKALARLPEVLVAVSFSKNFGLYRDRVGALLVLTSDPASVSMTESHVKNVARGMYSMPPAHGALIVATILDDDTLRLAWQKELDQMAQRLSSLRSTLVEALVFERPELNVDWLVKQNGMFSLLGLSREQVAKLKSENHIYMVPDSRINIAGLDSTNIPILSKAIAPLINSPDRN